MKTMHLICNAHLDPVWLWDWEEGAAAAVATFRSAVNLAREFDFIFCHNEALLYQWIEEYEPTLFAEIQKLAHEGKWKIMGGWYLQPDCNIPAGESLVRQMMEGRRYFKEKFNQCPTTAINVDPFGHSLGLPQLLRGCGFDSYLIGRPLPSEGAYPDDFMWKSPEGSAVRVCRVAASYRSPMGGAAKKIRDVLEKEKDKDVGIVLWGVGNHGGGPSRKDLTEIEELMRTSDIPVFHSTPEAYMAEHMELPVVTTSLNPCMPGCYTSMVRVKQQHHLLESTFYAVEKMCAATAIQTGMVYPMEELEEAQKSLMFAQFHDILPGSTVPAGEETALRVLDHGLEIVRRLRMRAMFALSATERSAVPGEYPVFVYNPNPYPVNAIVDVSFVLEKQNGDDVFTDFTMYDGERPLPTQVVKEPSNLPIDWAKQVVFNCTLRPMTLNRFDGRPQEKAPQNSFPKVEGDIVFENDRMKARIGGTSGLLEYYEVDGMVLLDGPTVPVLYRDNADPWAMNAEQIKRLAKPEEEFRLMTPKEAAQYSGGKDDIAPIRMIEDGAVMTEIESLHCCRSSALRINWRLYKEQPDIDVTLHLLFLEKDKLVKWHLPLAFKGSCKGQVAYGQEIMEPDGREVVAQNWVSASDHERMFAVLRKGSYALDCSEKELRLTLVRSAAYAAFPVSGHELVKSDRIIPRMDQGERTFMFRLIGGQKEDLENTLERRSQSFAETPFALQMFPAGVCDKRAESLIELEGEHVVMSAFKASHQGGYILRFFNNTSKMSTCICKIADRNLSETITFRPYEVRTFRLTQIGLNACDAMEI